MTDSARVPASELLGRIEQLEKEKTQLEHRLRMGPPSGRGALAPHEREELRQIAEARANRPATKRVADLIFVALDVLEQTDIEIERLKANQRTGRIVHHDVEVSEGGDGL